MMHSNDHRFADRPRIPSGRSRRLAAVDVTYVVAALTCGAFLLPGSHTSGTADRLSGYSYGAQDTTVSFARNVFPILERSCLECHGKAGEDGEPVVEEGLNMLTYEGLMAGSLYGKVIEPGNPDESYLIELIAAGDMPKEGDALKPEEIELIRRWILAGAQKN